MNLSNFTEDELLAEIERRRAASKNEKIIAELISWACPVGLWEVKTEGDCEGRTMKSLGIHRGHVAEIALSLSDQVCYGLHFYPIKEEAKKPFPKKDKPLSVSISLNIKSGTWVNDPVARRDAIAAWMDSVPPETAITVSTSSQYACVTVSKTK